MLKQRTVDAIKSLITASHAAAAINFRLQQHQKQAQKSLSASALEDENAELRAQVEILTQRISDLEDFIAANAPEDSAVPMTAEQVQTFRKTLLDSLEGQALVIAQQFYGPAYMAECTPEVRCLVATTMCEWTDSKKYPPDPLWYDLMVNNGAMKGA